VDLVLFGGTHWGETIDFIKKDDGWLHESRLLEKILELTFRFADPFVQDIGTLAHEKSNLLVFR
jgi:hypothetical protein